MEPIPDTIRLALRDLDGCIVSQVGLYVTHCRTEPGRDLHDYRIFADRAPASDAFAGRRIRQIEAAFASFDRVASPDP
jgi:hypothetical protein